MVKVNDTKILPGMLFKSLLFNEAGLGFGVGFTAGLDAGLEPTLLAWWFKPLFLSDIVLLAVLLTVLWSLFP